MYSVLHHQICIHLSICLVWLMRTCLKILWLCCFLRLAIGTDQGFTVVDTITNKCLYILSNLTSILCKQPPIYIYPFCISFNHSLPTYVADLATQEIRRGSTPATFSPKPTVMKHASVRSMSTQQFRVIFLCRVSTSFSLEHTK